MIKMALYQSNAGKNTTFWLSLDLATCAVASIYVTNLQKIYFSQQRIAAPVLCTTNTSHF